MKDSFFSKLSFSLSTARRPGSFSTIKRKHSSESIELKTLLRKPSTSLSTPQNKDLYQKLRSYEQIYQSARQVEKKETYAHGDPEYANLEQITISKKAWAQYASQKHQSLFQKYQSRLQEAYPWLKGLIR